MKLRKKYPEYFFIILFLIVIIISFFIIKDLIFPILYSIVLAFFFYPLYKRINSLIKVNWISALIMILLMIFIVTIPLVFISDELIKESLKFYSVATNWQIESAPFIKEGIKNIMISFNKTASDFLFDIPAKLINVFVSLFLLFYFFIDGENLINKIKEVIPLDDKKRNLFFNEFRQVSYSVVYGSVLTGIIIGILSGIGFYIFKVNSPVLLSFIVMILVILPIVGSALVWLPISISKIINGDNANGIGLIIYNSILSIIGMMLTYKLMSKKSKMHPVLIIIGVIGGLKFFGFIGIIFGPFILAVLITMLKYLVIKNETKD